MSQYLPALAGVTTPTEQFDLLFQTGPKKVLLDHGEGPPYARVRKFMEHFEDRKAQRFGDICLPGLANVDVISFGAIFNAERVDIVFAVTCMTFLGC